jgi:signal transduction histidine kinase
VKVGAGSRLGRDRRDRIAYIAMLRRSSRYNLRATSVRCAAVGLVLVLAAAERQLLAVLLALPALGCCALQFAEYRLERDQTLSRVRLVAAHQRSSRRTDGRQRMPAVAYVEIVGGLLLVAIPSWVVAGAPSTVRLLMLAAAALHVASTSLAIFTDHAWYNPDETDARGWHEIARMLAGPLTAGLVSLVALPAHWPEDAWLGALVLCLGPLLVTLRIRNSDLTVASLAPLVREEAHAGRELVISETHGALSTHLRLLEQEARRVRRSAPAVYELAVSAGSRLRETLTLARIGEESSTSPETLAASVLTLARAVGAQVRIDISVDSLSNADRELARLVLSDLAGNAVNAGAGAIEVSVRYDGPHLVIQVKDDAPAMPASVWKSAGTSSARLEQRLTALSGSLTCQQGVGTKAVEARWAPQGRAAEAADGDDSGTGAAG